MSRQLRLVIISCAAALLIVVVCIVAVKGGHAVDPLDPTKTSTRLIQMAPFVADTRMRGYNYDWIDEHTIFVNLPNGRCSLVDVVTGKAAECIKMEHAIAGAEFVPRDRDAVFWSVSPDRKWAMTNAWLAHQSKGRQSEWIVAKLDGTKLWTFPDSDEDGGNFYWGADSKSWYAVDPLDQKYESSLREFRISPNNTLALVQSDTKSDDVAGDGIIQPLPDGDFTAIAPTNGNDEEDNGMNIVDFKNGTTESIAHYDDPFPDNAYREACLVSPSGKQVAWKCSTGIDMTQELIAMESHNAIQGQGTIFVSDLDGSNMRKVVETSRQSTDDSPEVIRWTPDGKRISYIYRGYLWTVPVN